MMNLELMWQRITAIASDRFNRQIKYDDRKRQYCEQNGISLECIKYTASNDQERLEKAIRNNS